MNNDDMDYSADEAQNKSEDSLLEEDSMMSNPLERCYDEIVEEMESFKDGLTKKIKSFQDKRQKILGEIEVLTNLRKQKESYITGLEGREEKLAEERQEFEAQKQEFKQKVQMQEKEAAII